MGQAVNYAAMQDAGRVVAQAGIRQGWPSVQSGTSIPHREEPVPLAESAPQGLGQERGATLCPVRGGKLVIAKWQLLALNGQLAP